MKRWTAATAQSDGFVFVTPEYYHGPAAVLKNAIDWVYPEWNRERGLCELWLLVVILIGVAAVDAGLRISQRVTPCRAFGLVFRCFVGDSDTRQSIVRVDDLGELLGPID